MNNKEFNIRCRAIIMHDEKLLIVKHDKNFDYYALPGGKMENGENPIECIERELLEEFGVKIQNPKLKYVNTWKKENIETLEFLFTIQNNEDFLDLSNNKRTHAGEIYEMLWMATDDEFNLLPKKVKNDFQSGNLNFSEVQFI